MNENVIDIKIIAKDMATSVLKGVSTAAKGMTSPFKLAASAAKGLFSAMTSLPGILAQVGGLLAFKSAVDAASNLEQLTISFTTMLGDATAAKELLNDIQQAALKTPFELPELEKATKSLIAFGISADDAVPTLIKLGDVSAGIGVSVGDIAEIYGKARVQGRLFAEDINQLTGRGIPIIAELAEQFGVAESEVRKLVEDGQVGFSNLEKAFTSMTSEGGQFAGLMESQSQSLAGIRSNISDTLGVMARDFVINTGIFDGIKNSAQNFLTLLSDNKDSIMQFGENAVKAFKEVGDTVESLISGDFSEGIFGLSADHPVVQGIIELRRVALDLAETWAEHVTRNIDRGREAIGRVTQVLGGLLVPIQEAARNVLPPFIEALKTIWDVMYNQVGPVILDVLVTAFETAEPILKVAIDILGVILPPILAALGVAFQAIGTVITTLWNVVKPIMNLFKGAFELFFGLIEWGWNNVAKPALEAIGTFVLEHIWPAIEPIATFVTKVFDAVKTTIEGAFNWVKYAVIYPFMNEVDIAIAQINNLIGKADEAANAQKRIKDRGNEAYNAAVNAGQIAGPVRKFAKGGSYMTNGPELIMVGDNPGGREQVNVTPLGPGQGGGSGSGINITVNNNGGGMNESQMAARLAFLIKNT